MTTFKYIGFIALCTFTYAAQAAGNFRLPNGKLISSGESKSSIIATVGKPESREIETIGVDEGRGGTPVKREILTYYLDSSIGGKYLVIVTIENNIAISITSKQMR